MHRIECLAYLGSSTKSFLRIPEMPSRLTWVTTLPSPNCTLCSQSICLPISMLRIFRGGGGSTKSSLTEETRTYHPGFQISTDKRRSTNVGLILILCKFANRVNFRTRLADAMLKENSDQGQSGELTLSGTIIDQISYVHAQQPTYPQNILPADSDYANLAGTIRYIIDMICWEKTVAEISVHCTGKRDKHNQSKCTHRNCVTMDDYWRTLLADITKQDGATFTYKTYTDFCTIYRKATHTMSTYDIAERYALTLSYLTQHRLSCTNQTRGWNRTIPRRR